MTWGRCGRLRLHRMKLSFTTPCRCNRRTEKPMSVAGMNHFTVLTDDVEGTARFYHDLLGLTVGPRPNFDFPGAWLYFGDQPILHLIGGRSKDELKPGVIDHMAFTGHDLAGTLW